ncbi:MAG TPA: PQQ-dependent sugar dehydrogenase [Planctomycetia bacterium]|nr:PQQ-dependent sugar dehydrogenase [Planctomycetia bacterium]
MPPVGLLLSLLAVDPTFECRWTDHPVTVDGSLDEVAWRHAAPIDAFRGAWLAPMVQPTKTVAKLLWDRENLYFAATMEDADLVAEIREHDGMCWHDDVFELFFRPDSSKPGYFEFQVTPANVTMDLFLPDQKSGGYERLKAADKFRWRTAVRAEGTVAKRGDRDRGWTVEGCIPWTDFFAAGGRPRPGDVWRTALCRFDRTYGKDPVATSCSPLSKLNFHRLEEYAGLRFVGPLESPGAVPVRIAALPPAAESRVVGSPDPPPPFRPVRAFPGLAIDFPICIVRQPDSDWFWFIDQKGPYAPTTLKRFRIEANGKPRIETLLPEGRPVAYDVVFHPRFAANGYVYIGLNEPGAGGKPATRIKRYTVRPNAPAPLDPKSEATIVEWPSNGHNGGAMAFALDGTFFVSSGDGTSESDIDLVGQDLSGLTAKILRVDVDHPDSGRHYSVPKDNPFVGKSGERPETWAFGMRNPWRMTVDARTGHLWVGQNGQDQWEQVYLIAKGANYGWSAFEGSHPFYPQRLRAGHPALPPTAEHPHSEARSITGGVVYYGANFPELKGAYVYGDYSTGKIWAMRHDGARVLWHRLIADSRLQITGFGIDAAGEILICDHRGEGRGGFHALARNDAPRATSFPRKLSETGLFADVAAGKLVPGAIPYSVNAEFWSDGAIKTRHIALPPGGVIDYSRSGGFTFPAGTVIVKSFQLEFKQGDPVSRKLIETRLLHQRDGEWYGYSYRWNDAGTDAELVDAAGADVDYVLESAAGAAKQTWHYPSRTECMVCHTRAANYVLGLSELQLNKPHDYGGVTMNQLAYLERQGKLRINWADEARKRARAAGKPEGMTGEDFEASLERGPASGQRQIAPDGLFWTDPSTLPRLVDPYDAAQPLGDRARSFLHANCSNCHVKEGGGNAQMELGFTTTDARMRTIGVKPLHDSFGLADGKLVAAGRPDSSVLLHRISHRGKGHMPPLSTHKVDDRAVSLLRDWIASLPPAAAPRSSAR